MKPKYTLAHLAIIGLLSSCFPFSNDDFQLSSGERSAYIYVLPDEPENVHLAVKDLISDVEKITGRTLQITKDPDNCQDGCVVIGSMNREKAS
ncbi:MAG: hypothetical protein GYB55_19460 [Cytophagales bacterium]|uniref:hypothetical protein n=1 Tax=Cyclobacterium marinum TaxID=104 RepID=UPI0030DA882C|nr:hypothetical protein [Cytophagales bacterium]|tara:strand:- start:19001 stop:19279 length:279 start_codon:yes stop_codon:yes gene_type:complete